MIIGITGKSGVGKTTYANKLSENNGFYAVHIDEISHEVMELEYIKVNLIIIFGNEVVKNGMIDRKYLGDLVFTNRHLYQEVSGLIWKETKSRIDLILSNYQNVILDWILLPNSYYWKMCDKKILIVADEEKRKKKVMERDKISKEYLRKRDLASISYENICFDEVIENKYWKRGMRIWAI